MSNLNYKSSNLNRSLVLSSKSSVRWIVGFGSSNSILSGSVSSGSVSSIRSRCNNRKVRYPCWSKKKIETVRRLWVREVAGSVVVSFWVEVVRWSWLKSQVESSRNRKSWDWVFVVAGRDVESSRSHVVRSRFACCFESNSSLFLHVIIIRNVVFFNCHHHNQNFLTTINGSAGFGPQKPLWLWYHEKFYNYIIVLIIHGRPQGLYLYTSDFLILSNRGNYNNGNIIF